MATLQEIRVSLDLSQYDVSLHTGLSRGTVSNAEAGKSIQKNTFAILCRELGVSPEDVEGVTIQKRNLGRKLKRATIGA